MTMTGPDYLDYHSESRTFALAFSSTSGSTSAASSSKSSRSGASPVNPFPTDLKLAVGSYIEGFADNDITVIGLNPSLLQDPEGYACANWSTGTESSGDNSPTGSASSQKTVSDFVPLAKAKHPYPVSKLDFCPSSLTNKLQQNSHSGGKETREMIATTSDCLRLWDLVEGDSYNASSNYVGRQTQRTGSSLAIRSELSNTKSDYTAPLTSFCWSTVDPSWIVTSSIDTTCTIWDISTNQAVTQLISHDREVFDVAWSPASRDMFASVGADGSVRSFDLRQLDHSTILYESSSVGTVNSDGTKGGRGTPLLRLAFNPNDSNSLAIMHADSPIVTILDIRSPGIAVAELRSHKAAVNGIAWCGSQPLSSSSGNQHYNNHGANGESTEATLATVGDDAQVLLWDLAQPNERGLDKSSPHSLPRGISLPNASYAAPSAVDTVAWGGGREYMAIGMGKTIRCLRA